MKPTPDNRTPIVLVIDDCEVARADMCDRLAGSGYEVSSLASPIGATRAIVERQVDVVVIDVQMPSIRGDRLAALFRGNQRLKALGVILVTGSSEAELADLARTAQMDAILSKAKLSELAPLVLRVFEQRRASRAGA